MLFSPTACVIAAVVVAFPLLYRNALGAFESLDRNMLDAARTLGWSNAKIFVRLMLPPLMVSPLPVLSPFTAYPADTSVWEPSM